MGAKEELETKAREFDAATIVLHVDREEAHENRDVDRLFGLDRAVGAHLIRVQLDANDGRNQSVRVVALGRGLALDVLEQLDVVGLQVRGCHKQLTQG